MPSHTPSKHLFLILININQQYIVPFLDATRFFACRQNGEFPDNTASFDALNLFGFPPLNEELPIGSLAMVYYTPYGYGDEHHTFSIQALVLIQKKLLN